LRVRTTSAVLISLVAFLAGTAPALASGTGGVAPTGSTTGTTSSGAAMPAKPLLHLAPVTSRSSSLAYSGPVYEKMPTGAIVPYRPVPAAGAQITNAQASSATGGSAVEAPAPAPAPAAKPELLVPGSRARYVGGLAAAPMSAPAAIQQIIWAGDQIVGLPYIYGGGHASFISPGYDCSGTVSFALHGANLLTLPEDSSEFMGWSSNGVGRWVAIFSNPGHAYMTVAGLRLDTSSADDPTNQQGPRWRPLRPANSGYTVRHPLGL
jgi:cell wall-associated NlpC family hydrolase